MPQNNAKPRTSNSKVESKLNDSSNPSLLLINLYLIRKRIFQLYQLIVGVTVTLD